MGGDSERKGSGGQLQGFVMSDKGGMESGGSGGCAVKVSTAVNAALTRFFKMLGKLVGSNPWPTLVVCLAVTFGLASAFANFKTESRPENLFVPQGTRSLSDQEDIDRYFGASVRFVSLVSETDPGGNNVLAPAALERALDFWLATKTVVGTTEAGQSFVLDDLCVKGGFPAECITTSIFDAWGENATVLAADADPVATLNAFFPDAEQLESMIGGVERSGGGTGPVVSAKAIRSTLLLNNNLTDLTPDDNDNRLTDAGAEAWEEALVTLALGFGGGILVYPQTSWSFGEEVGGSIGGDVPLVTASYFIIVLFIVFVLNDRCDRVDSSIALALLAVLTIGLSIVSAFGLSQLANVRYGNTHTILVFIVLGVGADGCFILANAWRRERSALLADRAADTLAHAGVSLTVSSMTNVLAFAIGSLTVIPDLSSFCVYASLCLFFLWVYLVTFFLAVLVLNERRLAKNKLDVLCCFSDGRVSAARDPKGEVKQEREARRQAPHEAGRLSRFMGEKVGPFFTQKWFSWTVVVAALVFVSVCAWQASTLTVEATGANFLPDGSYLKTNFELQAKYFGGAPTTVSIVVKEFDIVNDRAELWNMPDKFQCATCRSSPPYVNPNFDSWLHEFAASLQALNVSGSLAVDPLTDNLKFPVTEADFNTALATWLATAGAIWANDIVLDATDGSVVRARMQIEVDPIGSKDEDGIFKEDTIEIVKAMDKLYEICDAFSMPVYPFARKFVDDWSSYKVVAQELLQNTLLCLACVLGVVTLLIGHPLTSGLVFLSTCFTIVELLGLLAMFDYAIDTVVVVLVVLAIGLSVDYSAHLAFSFMLEQGTRQERVAKVLGDVGVPVLNGAISTFLAICLQSLSSSYVFRVVFICFFFSIIASILNGLVLLPVALGLVGPRPYHTSVKTDHDEDAV